MNKDPKSEQEILPCPFCGEAGRITWWGSPSQYWITSCYSQKCIIWHEAGHTTAFSSKEKAIKAWNLRQSPPMSEEIKSNTEINIQLRSKINWYEAELQRARDNYDAEIQSLTEKVKQLEGALELKAKDKELFDGGVLVPTQKLKDMQVELSKLKEENAILKNISKLHDKGEKDNQRLRECLQVATDALDRLGSSNAFDIPRGITENDIELIARMNFAREALSSINSIKEGKTNE